MKWSKYEVSSVVLSLEMQNSAPVLDYQVDEAEQHNRPAALESHEVEAVEARDRVDVFVHKESRDYYGRGVEVGYVTAPQLKEVLGCSHDTALRWLDRFDKAGVLTFNGDVNGKKLYELNERFRQIQRGNNDYKTPDEVTETAAEVMELVSSV